MIKMQKETKPNILFIIPPFSEQVSMKGEEKANSDKEIRVYPFLGVCYLIGSLKKYKFEVDLIDAPAEGLKLEELIQRIKLKNPTIIGITVTSFMLNICYQLVNECKKHTSAKIILGGVHITHLPQDFQYFNADYGLRGDCEFTIVQLVEAIFNLQSTIHIPGIIYKDDSKVIVTPPAKVEDLDGITFPDRTVLKGKYLYPILNKKFTTIIGSRGCPYKCVYCGFPYNKSYRKRSTENIINELRIIEEQGYEYVSFSDDIFTLDKSRVVEFCKHYKSNSLSIKWGCSTRVDCVDYPLLRQMKQDGCIDIRFGIETGNENLRFKIIHKCVTNQQFIEAVDFSKKVGLFVTGFFLFGHPDETKENMKETVDFAKRLKLDYVAFMMATPLPNSELFSRALKENKLKDTIWKDVILGKEKIPIYTPVGISFKEMKDIFVKATPSFYLRPRYILRHSFSKDIFFLVKNGINLLLARRK